jgi:hypothetical protein
MSSSSFLFYFRFLTSTCAGFAARATKQQPKFVSGEFGLVRSYISGLNTHADEILGKLY